MPPSAHPTQSEPDYEVPYVFCECENCTHRWTEDGPFVVTIRCPIEDCGSKNVHISSPEGDDL